MIKASGKNLFTGKVKNGNQETRPEVNEALKKIEELMISAGIEKLEIEI